MNEFPIRRLDEFMNDGAVMLGRGDVISKEDIEAHRGPYPIYSSSAHNNGKFGEYGKFMFDEELLTWSVDGGGNFFYRNKHRYSVTNVCGYMRLKSQELHPKFVFYSLANQHRFLTFDYTSKAHPSVIKKQYWLPAISVAHQQKIAAILTATDTSIEKTEALIAKYQQIKAGLMHDLFTRGVLPNGQLRPPREQAPELYQETAIGWIPREWHPVSLRDLVGAGSIINGPFGSDLLTSELKPEGVSVLYVQDIKPGSFTRVSSAHITDQKANQLAFCNVRQGDVLVAKVGDPPCDSCVYERDERAVVTQDVIRIRPTTAVVSSYLAALLNATFGRKAIKRISIEGTRERVSLTEFKSLIFPIAKSDEQLLIARRIDGAQAAISAEFGKLAKLKRQKLGLMQDLLTGKVTVQVVESVAEAVNG